ncbi:hypothetical protein TNIN_460011 [Trichonephila inaurata madagascariensis]|uniref:Uncharacterized protein n=1 Tax=Trichonephila inaurata madagascariensis TaxID=2747483 RepID=A0A8X6YDE8_9ARAC|nr:hypothetical protein TNIN_460011 [Trichonephila inaurata madagascariensis]
MFRSRILHHKFQDFNQPIGGNSLRYFSPEAISSQHPRRYNILNRRSLKTAIRRTTQFSVSLISHKNTNNSSTRITRPSKGQECSSGTFGANYPERKEKEVECCLL